MPASVIAVTLGRLRSSKLEPSRRREFHVGSRQSRTRRRATSRTRCCARRSCRATSLLGRSSTRRRSRGPSGLSTTPLREALRRLKSEGLVELGAHRDAKVTDLSAEEARDLVEVRRRWTRWRRPWRPSAGRRQTSRPSGRRQASSRCGATSGPTTSGRTAASTPRSTGALHNDLLIATLTAYGTRPMLPARRAGGRAQPGGTRPEVRRARAPRRVRRRAATPRVPPRSCTSTSPPASVRGQRPGSESRCRRPAVR